MILQLEVGHALDQLLRFWQARMEIFGGHPSQSSSLVDDALERIAREVGRRCGRGRAAGKYTQRQPLLARVRHRVDLPEAHRSAEGLLFDEEAVGGCRTTRRRALEHVSQQRGVELGHTAVPPTVIPSRRIVGKPTPTGTDWPSLPQVPTPSSSARSCPTRLTRVSASGPLPISVAPFTGFVTRPSSIR